MKQWTDTRVNGVSLLTVNMKTGCPSWSVSRKSCTGAKNSSICRSCYGSKGNFTYPVTQNALKQRHSWFEKSDEGEIVDIISSDIKKTGQRYFRAYVVGDFANERAIRIWNKIAESLPRVKFWFPTKAHKREDLLPLLRKLNSLKNVAVRPSAMDWDEAAPNIEGLSAGSASYKGEKPENHKNCGGSCKRLQSLLA